MSRSPEAQRLTMVERQLRRRGIEDDRVLAALARVPRELFVPPGLGDRAYEDEALPIGHGATISQPFMVARMTELLDPRPGAHVLDVGTGSGYQAAVLAELGAEVETIERVPALAEQARKALEAAGYSVRVHVGDGSLGLPERAPFDGIVVAAAAPGLPHALYDQLGPQGRLVVPIGSKGLQELQLVVPSPEGPAVLRSVPCRFVPLVGEGGFSGGR